MWRQLLTHDATTERLGPRTISGELLKKYEKSGPRYTSYPTAPQFRADLNWDEVSRRWRASNDGEASGLSLYTHIPFCKSRCAYCGCYTTVGAEDDEKKRYVEAILRNADWVLETLDSSRPVEQLALGGGTPTNLEMKLLERLVKGLQERFSFSPSGERAIEIDPRWIDTDYLDLLVELGFNRFSFGVQDLDPTVQEQINRVLPEEKLEELLEHLRGLGHSSINLDLIYGLPGQTTESFRHTLQRIIALRPSRIATFGYAHVPWVAPHQKALERYGLLGPEERMELFGLAYDLFLDAGWRHVGMDHFALPDDELVTALESRTLTRNFMGYTTRKGLDLVPLGASAIGAVAATYVQNVKEIDSFIASQGRERWVRGFALSAEDLLRREVILELLCNFHLDMETVGTKHGVEVHGHFHRELDELEELEKDGLIRTAGGELSVTDLGRFFIRNITMIFDAYLRKEDGLTQRYSKTI